MFALTGNSSSGTQIVCAVCCMLFILTTSRSKSSAHFLVMPDPESEWEW